MHMIPYTNTKDHVVHIAGKAIQPGQTRPVPATQHPDYEEIRDKRVQVAASQDTGDPVLALLDGSVKELTEAIADREKVSDEDLDRLAAAEQDGKTRKGALAAIEEEKLERATNPGPTGPVGLEELSETIQLTDEKTVGAQEVLDRAFAASELSVEDWNALTPDVRQDHFRDAIDALVEEASEPKE